MVSTDEIRALATKLKAAGVATSIMDAMEKAKDILINSEKTLNDMENYNKRVRQDEQDLARVDEEIQQIDNDISQDDDRIKKELTDIEELDEEIKKEEEKQQILPREEPEVLEIKEKTLNELYSEDNDNDQKLSQQTEIKEDIEGANNFNEVKDTDVSSMKNDIIQDIEGADNEPLPVQKNGVIQDIEGANNNEIKVEEEPIVTEDEDIQDIEGADNYTGNTEDEVLVSADEAIQDVEGANNYEDMASEKISSDDISEYVPEHPVQEKVIPTHKNKEAIREDMDDLIEDGTKETDEDQRI